MGKGSARRPQQISQAEMRERWNLTFGHYGRSLMEDDVDNIEAVMRHVRQRFDPIEVRAPMNRKRGV